MDNIAELIRSCRQGDVQAREQLFDAYRSYLRMLARAQMGRHLQSKCDPSDLVQQTLLEAFRDFSDFTGTQEQELLAWLRRILAHNLYNETRRFRTQQREAAREVSLEQIHHGLEHSSLALGRCLADPMATPSQLAVQREAALRLADALARLPDDYQTVLLLRVFEELPAEEVALRMDRSAGAVRMLQMRALKALGEELGRE